ncbi:MAG TPA: hypothetical protein VF897_15295, partial [Roseiflexaceae bacterium]
MKRSSHPLASLFHARSSRRAAALIVLALVLSSLPISSRAAAPQATLQIDAPAQVAAGQPIELALTVRAAADLAGFEAAVDFDTAVAEFAGLDRRSSGLARTGRDVGALTIPELPGGSVIALYSCPAASCVDGSGPQQPLGASGDVALATFDILPLRPGTLEIALDPLKFVDAAGNPTPVAVPNHTIVVQVGPPGAGPRYPAPAGPWALGQAAAAPASLDLTGDGLVSHADLMEVALAWTRAREHGRVCGALVDSSRDVNGDGCVDVADLQLLATRYSPAGQGAPPQVEAAAPLTLVVNSTGDTGDAQIGDGVCKTSAGSCTLRAAIQEANAHAGPDQINFAISGTGVHTIQLGAELPALNDTSGGTTIDGYSQPGAVPNTDPLVSNTTIHVEVEGEGASGLDALPITSAGNVVRGLAFYNLHRSIWLFGGGAHDNRLIGNFIGTNAAGTFKLTFNTVDALGVHISQGASRNHIGDTAPADRNVISGNARSGVGLWDQGTDDNIIVNNIVGLNPSGTSRLANANHGIDMNFGVSYTIVGGTGPGERNVVSGNQHQGIEISHLASTSYNWVVGNYVGTDVTGKQGPAYARNDGFGIQTKDRVANNLVADNVVGNNQMAGIRVDEYGTCCVGRNQFTNNRVGLGVDGSSIPNRVAGFLITAGNTLVGPGNIIANNPIGVAIDGDASDGNTITHNAIYGNSGLGIDLGPLGMVNQNDQGDGDSGPNQQLNFPVLQSATPS